MSLSNVCASILVLSVVVLVPLVVVAQLLMALSR